MTMATHHERITIDAMAWAGRVPYGQEWRAAELTLALETGNAGAVPTRPRSSRKERAHATRF
jgi:hypothetical protein